MEPGDEEHDLYCWIALLVFMLFGGIYAECWSNAWWKQNGKLGVTYIGNPDFPTLDGFGKLDP